MRTFFFTLVISLISVSVYGQRRVVVSGTDEYIFDDKRQKSIGIKINPADFFIKKIGAIVEMEIDDWFFIDLGAAAIVNNPEYYNIADVVSEREVIRNATGGYNFSIAPFFVLNDDYLGLASGISLSYDYTQYFGENVNVERVQRLTTSWVNEFDFLDRFYASSSFGVSVRKVNDMKLFSENIDLIEYVGVRASLTFGFILKE